MSEVPEFFSSIVFSNFQDKNIEHDLDTNRLLATPVIGLETARVIKKWRKLVASANQRLANARAKYAATRGAEAVAEFSRVSIEVASIPAILYNALEFAKATDETRAKRAELRRIYGQMAEDAYANYVDEFYRIKLPSSNAASSDSGDGRYELLEKAHKAYLEKCNEITECYESAKVDAFVMWKYI
jgi:hypothetical protein